MNTPKTLTVLALCLSSQFSQAAETVTLKVAHFLPATSNAQRNVIQPWCDKLAEESANRIQCQIYPSMQLGGTPAQLPDQVRRGVADVVWTAPGYSTGRFPRSEAVELPFMLPPSGETGSKIIWEFYQRALQEDYKDFKVLALHSDGGMQLHNARRNVATLQDFRGLKLRASTRMTSRLLDALGATPVSMPPAQMTESLSKGVIDGALVGWEVIPALKLDEVTHFHAEPNAGQPIFSTTLLSFLMNKQRYDNLPEDLSAIIDRNSGLDLSMTFGASWDKEGGRARQVVADQGATLARIDNQDYRSMREVGDKVTSAWSAEADDKGLKGSELARTLREIAMANGLKY